MCEQGALSFYLHVRFLVTDEPFDFSDNKNWHHIRVAVGIGNPNSGSSEKYVEKGRIKNMGSSTFRKAMDAAFEACGYHASHTNHFGRSCAPVLLEFAEVMGELIKILGNWGLEVYEKHYGMKMPWEAMRAAAGFVKEIGRYYLARGRIVPPRDLINLVFPNIIRAKLAFEALPEEVKKPKETVRNFLEVMDHLAVVFLQDACVMLLDESRASHQFFQLPIFQMELFQAYKHSFDLQYATLVDPANDPTYDPLKKAVPRVGHHLHDLNIETHRQGQRLHQVVQEVGELRQEFRTSNEQAQRRLDDTYNLVKNHHLHINHVLDAAATANTHSPFRMSFNDLSSPTQEVIIHQLLIILPLLWLLLLQQYESALLLRCLKEMGMNQVITRISKPPTIHLMT